MKKSAVSFVAASAACLLLMGCDGAGSGKGAKVDYPTKEISLICGYTPGGSSDLIDRALSQSLGKSLSQPVVIVNRDGANGTVSLAEVVKAKADGYTLVHGVSGHFLTEPIINEGVRYKQEDFDLLANMTTEPILLTVNASSPYKTWEDLVKASKENNVVIRYATSGMGSLMQLSAGYMFQQGGIKAQPVPFKGSAPVITAALGNHVEIATTHPAEVLAHIKSGKLIPLVISSASRFKELPDTPTMKEKGIDVDLGVKKFIMAPKGLPADVKKTLVESMRKAIADSEFQKKMDDLHIMVDFMDSNQLETYINQQKPIIKALIESIKKEDPK
jgi:tripartite-type tricarboxylate transporter receptor subunit TctC